MKKKTKFDWFIAFLYIISFATVCYFLWDGWNFYQTAGNLQPRHPDYRNLRPAGFRGHGFGIIGSAMMLIMLLYSVRKRTALFGKSTGLSYWLKIHIYFGVLGPLLITLHTGLKLHGLVAVSFWSMVVVAGSGILGRYLYLQIPRTLGGEELSSSELAAQSAASDQFLAEKYQIDTTELHEYNQIFMGSLLGKGPFLTALRMFIADITRFIGRLRLKRAIQKKHTLPHHEFTALFDALYQKVMLHRRIILLDSIRQIFHYWHVLHKPFAIIMYLIMFVHIIIAVLMGYTWIF